MTTIPGKHGPLDPAAIEEWTRANQRAIREYAEHPFADGRVKPRPNDYSQRAARAEHMREYRARRREEEAS